MKTSLAAVLLLAAVVAVVPLSAHHSWPVSFGQLVTVKGTVTDFAWENPHPMISLDVRGSDGKIEKWSVGGPAITRMEASGWTRTTLKVGDVMTVQPIILDGNMTVDGLSVDTELRWQSFVVGNYSTAAIGFFPWSIELGLAVGAELGALGRRLVGFDPGEFYVGASYITGANFSGVRANFGFRF